MFKGKNPWIGALGVILLGILMVAYGCGGGGGGAGGSLPASGGSGPQITSEQAAQLLATDQAVSDVANQHLSNATFSDAQNTISGMEGVQSVSSTSDSLTVKYVNGGRHIWKTSPLVQRPPYIPERALSLMARGQHREPVGNLRALIVNCISADPGFVAAIEPLDQIQKVLENGGFQVDRINDTDANLDYLASKLSDYSFITYLGHGSSGAETFSLQTGQRYAVTAGDLINHGIDWITGKLDVVTVEWGSGTDRNTQRRVYWAITNKFIQDNYHDAGKMFPHSIFYNCACQSLTNSTMADALVNSGCAAYVGWTETQDKGPWSAWELFAFMATNEGESLGDAFNLMPSDAKSCDITENGQAIHADLQFVPSSASTVQLWETGQNGMHVNIGSPANGATIMVRTLTVTGNVSDCPSDARGTITVNGQASTALPITAGSFSQTVVLTPGANTIQVSIVSSRGGAAGQVSVNANIEDQALWTELRWDTNYSDVDLHLLPPGYGLEYLWTAYDCYYLYKGQLMPWGSTLDVDDVDGYGPEHITMNAMPQSGRYTLVAHYFNNHGVTGTTRPEVYVSTNSGMTQHFGPAAFTQSYIGQGHGNIWTICYIDFPSGVITPINALEVSTVRSSHPPAKAGLR